MVLAARCWRHTCHFSERCDNEDKSGKGPDIAPEEERQATIDQTAAGSTGSGQICSMKVYFR